MGEDRLTQVERRLSAILAADVAGYSRLMHSEEEPTHIKLSALLAGTVNPSIAEHGGRVVKNTGDGLLAEFPSAVQAVRSAVQFQTRIKELTAAEVADRRITFRVGINIGDVIVEPHDIFGDSVNIAARLQSIAEPGGICISSSTYEHVCGKVGVAFVDLGEQNLKNIHRPVRAYAIVGDGVVPRPENARSLALSTPRLSIVVLPFVNLSGDSEQDYFADGVTESLTTDLSRISGSFVIGRHTAFTYKGKTLDLRQVGRELNVRYVLEGSVQRSSNRLRVGAQLVDAETGAQLWTDRFDKPFADLFDMQDEIVSRLANTLDTQLIEAEVRRAIRSPHPDSMDLYFQGKSLLYRGWSPECLAQARGNFERALALDSENIEAMIWMAVVDLIVGLNCMSDDRRALISVAEAILLKVVSVAPNNAFGHLALGALLNATHRAVNGIAECERALVLDRNLADAHARVGAAKILIGQEAEAEAHINEAFRLSPRDIFAFDWLMLVGFAKLQLAADSEAIDWFRRGIEANRNHPLTHFGLAAALALVGSLDQARAAVKAGLALNPGFTIRRFGGYALRVKHERIYVGLRAAGVPEG
ncbi:TolB-like protein/class 3 adenylate cyclase/Tfp pilus assembly protein PilF [Bradyrhizobium sp. LB8.2]|uniref:adenylate/guanylate cyclase domain-containing protein n=1 Tax=unclassified Bradyrhizobium TaxID=2631580 RepID=UPI003393C838